MDHEKRMDLFYQTRQRHLNMGGEKKLEARKSRGYLNVRERIDYFFDPGNDIITFAVTNMFERQVRTSQCCSI